MSNEDQFHPPALNIDKLIEEFKSAGLPVQSVGWQNDLTLFYLWSVQPSPAQVQQASELVAAHNPTADANETARINFEANTRAVIRKAAAHTSNGAATVLAYTDVPLTSELYVAMVVMAASSTGVGKTWVVNGVAKRLNGGLIFIPPGSPGAAISGPFQDAGASAWAFTSQIDAVNTNRLNFVGTGAAGAEIDWAIYAIGILLNP